MYSFLFKRFNMVTKNVTRLYATVCKAKKLGRNGGHPSTCCLCTLQSPYVVPGLVQTGFTDFCISFDININLELTTFLQMLSGRFSSLPTKFRKASSFSLNT